MARIARDDENEADKYGLMLMSRAGYDPDAMRTFMAHLGAVEETNHDVISKYLADHPETKKRLANLNGDPELNPALRTDDQRVAQAIHDFDTGRYNIAAMKFADVLKRRPDDATARFQLGQSQLALGQIAKGEQNLTAAGAERLAAGQGAGRRAHQGAARRRAPPQPAAPRPHAAARAARDRPGQRDAGRRPRSRPAARRASTRSSRCATRIQNIVYGCRTSRACSRARTRASTR